MASAFETIGRLVPRGLLKELSGFLDMAGVNEAPDRFAGQTASASLAVSVLAALSVIYLWPEFVPSLAQALAEKLPQIADASTIISYLLFFALALIIFSGLTVMCVYAFLVLALDARRKQLENVLPDFLQLSAANVRAGMPVDQALWFAARPEFGLFAQEIELAAKRTFGGEPFAQSLDKLVARFNSKYLKRSIALIKQGLSSGGEMGEILERTGEDIRNMQILYKEISAAMLSYIIFIVVASILGAPFLFGVSYKLINVLEKVFEKLPPLENLPTALPITPSAPPIKSAEFLVFAFFSCTLTAIFASLIISVVQSGSKKNGAKLIPLFLIITWAVLATIILVLNSWFAGIIQ